MTTTKDCDGNRLKIGDVVENIHQPGRDFRFYTYVGKLPMGEYGGKVMALFSNNVHPDNDLHEYSRDKDGRVAAMRLVKEKLKND